jgi:hypothetical protein
LQAGGVAAELLKTGIADGDGSPRTIKLELHRIVFVKLSPRLASITLHRTLLAQQLLFRRGEFLEFPFIHFWISQIQ